MEYRLSCSAIVRSGDTVQLGTIFTRDILYTIVHSEGNVLVDFMVMDSRVGLVIVKISTSWDSKKNRKLFRQSKAFKELLSKTKHLVGKYLIELRSDAS